MTTLKLNSKRIRNLIFLIKEFVPTEQIFVSLETSKTNHKHESEKTHEKNR